MRSFRCPVHQRFVLDDFRFAGPPERQPFGMRRGRRRRRRRPGHGGHRHGRGSGGQRSGAVRAVRRCVRDGDAHVGRRLLWFSVPVRAVAGRLVLQRQRQQRVGFGLWRRFADGDVHGPAFLDTKRVRVTKYQHFGYNIIVFGKTCYKSKISEHCLY